MNSPPTIRLNLPPLDAARRVLHAQAQAALARSGLPDTSGLALLADRIVEREN